ncbi:programmed cell death protein 6-like [Artemia franciscana]|uniref:EF-hand domain-containing protein n=1 Tax=Artemia franciscana TaxID=6661 RepID=A0AA88L1P0_ARTSF|nr:hypothetical protein QYM36_011774 [Artemia franciscana]
MQGNLPSREYLAGLFQNVDKDRSGSITANELGAALLNGSMSPFNPETIRLMIGMFDRDNNGTINFEEFCSLWKFITDWQNCFKNFDRDNSGTIDVNEFRQALIMFGYRLQESLVCLMHKKFDRHGRGTIYFDDFIQCCIILQNLTSAFRKKDSDLDGVVTLHYEEFICLVLDAKV